MEKIKGTNFYLIKEVEPKIRKNGQKRRMGLFKCKCGIESVKDMSRVNEKGIKSCIKCSIKSSAKTRIKHGLISHPLYLKWSDMKKRCYNKKVDRYNCYGALGITVCDEWKNNFISFYGWCMDNGWTKNLTIDRIDNKKGYCPENCRLITMDQQSFNKNNTFYVEISKNYKVGLSELLHLNNCSNRYNTVRAGIKLYNKTLGYYIDKYNLILDFDFLSIKKINNQLGIYDQEYCEFKK